MTIPAGAGAPLEIGVFDSGVGGLSVLRALRTALPGAALGYYADSHHAPYGERDAAHVLDRARRITDALVKLGARAIVVACNTATALAIDRLREEWPQLPFVGVEPGIKPAVARSKVQRIGVLATTATLRSPRFLALVERHAGPCEVVVEACPGLAARIERGHLEAADLVAMIDAHCDPLRRREVDVVVLGCTHYPFVRAQVEAAMGPAVEVIDTAAAVARQAAAHFAPIGTHGPAVTRLMTHADPHKLTRLARGWLPFDWHLVPGPESLR